MECDCGFSFSTASRQKPRPYRSYALIDDRQYRKFLRAEMKAVASKSLKDIARASAYVGSLCICPDCGRVRVRWPDCETPATTLEPPKEVAAVRERGLRA